MDLTKAVSPQCILCLFAQKQNSAIALISMLHTRHHIYLTAFITTNCDQLHVLRLMRIYSKSVKPELRVLKNWLSQNAAGFDCKEASAGTELAEEEEGRGEERWVGELADAQC